MGRTELINLRVRAGVTRVRTALSISRHNCSFVKPSSYSASRFEQAPNLSSPLMSLTLFALP